MVTLSFISYSEIEGLSSVGRIRKLLNIAKENKIILLEGKLNKKEEAELIKATMEEINKDFKGIELAVIDTITAKNAAGLKRFRNAVFGMLLGNRQGMTVIGPASVVKEIKKDPNKIELLTQESKAARTRKKKKR